MLDPQSLVPTSSALTTEQSKRLRIAAWEVCLEELRLRIGQRLDGLIILDTAGASLSNMEPLFSTARRNDHQVFYVFVSTKTPLCACRAGDAWITEDSVSYYRDRFRETVPTLKKLADKFFLIDNNDDKKTLALQASKVARVICNK